MKTICFKISYDEESKKIIDSDSRVFSSAYRMAYNLFWKGESQTAVLTQISKSSQIIQVFKFFNF